MVSSVFLNIIFLFFPLCCYFMYLVYSKTTYEEEKLIFLDLALFSSFYFCSRFGKISFMFVFLINIPLLLAIYRRRLFPSIVLSIITPIFLSRVYEINVFLFLLQYIIIFILGFFSKFNIKNVFVICKLLFGIVIILFFESNVINFNSFIYLFGILVIMYLIFHMILLFYDRLFTIVKMYNSLNETLREKQLYESLFKITHEIKNPLAVCKGYLDMFDINNPAKANRYASIINQEIDRTLLLLQDFSNISKLNINKNMIEANILLEDVCDEASLILNNSIVFKYHILPNEIYINGDYNRLKQVLINIIKNAKEAIDEKGVVELKTSLKNDKYIITIKDNGCGMDKETYKKVGTAFYTTKKNGTGLGVCFSKEIIEKHDGTMKYISKLGKGTTVRISLPIKK